MSDKIIKDIIKKRWLIYIASLFLIINMIFVPVRLYVDWFDTAFFALALLYGFLGYGHSIELLLGFIVGALVNYSSVLSGGDNHRLRHCVQKAIEGKQKKRVFGLDDSLYCTRLITDICYRSKRSRSRSSKSYPRACRPYPRALCT